MTAAFVLYDRLTALDFVGAYDPITRLASMDLLPGFTWNLCALQEPIADARGLQFLPDRVGEPLDGYDLLVVPGGSGPVRCGRIPRLSTGCGRPRTFP
jgi:putative intracellular protease/amidase